MKQAIFLLLTLSFVFLSCGKRSIVRQYYIIEFPVEIDSSAATQSPLNGGYCEILPVQIAPAYAGERIAVRTNSHQLNYYFEHQWAVRPEESLLAQTQGYLQSRHFFAIVSTRLSRIRPDFELFTRVQHLEAVQEKGKLLARLHLDWELHDAASDKIVVFYSFDVSRPLAKKNINLLATALSGILEEELHQFADKIANYLSQIPENSSPVSGGK